MRTVVLLAFVMTTCSLPVKDESYEDDEEDWECGNDPLSKYLSESQIDIDCPHLKKGLTSKRKCNASLTSTQETINQCCIRHDNCYDKQLGRKHCDDTFCSCLTVVTLGSGVCGTEDGPLFCRMVREFGETAYLRSGNVTRISIVKQLQSTGDLVNRTRIPSNQYKLPTSSNDTAGSGLLHRETSLLETLLRPHRS